MAEDQAAKPRSLYWGAYPWLVSGALLIVILDQWTKYLARTRLAYGQIWQPIPALGDWFQVVRIQNTGVAFGMFQGDWGWIFALLAAIVCVVILVVAPRIPAHAWPAWLALTLMLGGALGNLIDRVLFGQVTDFIAIRYFAVLNLADASLTAGVAVLILAELFSRSKSFPK